MRAFPEKIDPFLNCIIAIKNLKSDACHLIVAFGKTQSALKLKSFLGLNVTTNQSTNNVEL